MLKWRNNSCGLSPSLPYHEHPSLLLALDVFASCLACLPTTTYRFYSSFKAEGRRTHVKTGGGQDTNLLLAAILFKDFPNRQNIPLRAAIYCLFMWDRGWDRIPPPLPRPGRKKKEGRHCLCGLAGTFSSSVWKRRRKEDCILCCTLHAHPLTFHAHWRSFTCTPSLPTKEKGRGTPSPAKHASSSKDFLSKAASLPMHGWHGWRLPLPLHWKRTSLHWLPGR